MTEEAAFVHAILTEPDDHVHRLIYADWLLEHDPAREAFVRRQAQLGPSVRTGLNQKLVPIPPGKFLMGSPENEPGRDPDEPLHEVTLTRPFYLAAKPVTVGEFRTFIRETGWSTEAEKSVGVFWVAERNTWQRVAGANWRHPGWKQDDDHPVVNLQWDDAIRFCIWLTARDGREYRLPTEAEWEYACRAGTQTAYYFGKQLEPTQANFRAGQKRSTTPVGQYPANAWGLFDMHGNVWEWCSDWYDQDYYHRGVRKNPRGPGLRQGRVLRGGSWDNLARDCRSALRRCGNPFWSRYHDGNTGFRLALSFPQTRRGRRQGEQRPSSA